MSDDIDLHNRLVHEDAVRDHERNSTSDPHRTLPEENLPPESPSREPSSQTPELGGSADSNSSNQGWFATIVDAFRDFFGLSDSSDSVKNDKENSSADLADRLTQTARQAFADHPHYCNQSTAFVASAFGIDELDGKTANQQIQHMEDNWKTVSAREAQQIAEQGGLCVAGLEKSSGSGHTAVVVPGNGKIENGDFYPNIAGGGGNSFGKSDGSKTVGDVWSNADQIKVRYFTPKD